MRLLSRITPVVALGFVVFAAPALAQSPADATARIVRSAQAVLATLDGAGRAKVQFPFDGPKRTNWSNLPTGIYKRDGLRMGDLSAPQRKAVMDLLGVALSGPGYQKVTAIMNGDQTLPKPNGGQVVFGLAEYYLAFVGTPSTTTPWILQFGGHHLAINLTLGGSNATMAPSHTAAQPASYTIEGRTVRPLGAENDKAFALVNALDAGQKDKAILNYRVADLVLGPGQDGKTIQPEGIPGSALNASQQAMLLDIIHEWAGIMNDAYAVPRMAALKAALPQTYFAWSGLTVNGTAAYFRIQGPSLVIEYAPQNSIDHIHTMYRDPTNDYGAAFTKK